MNYNISRFEQQGDSLFICINSENNPVYIEHFFSESEKLDKEGTIARLVAELEIKDGEYVAPLPVVNKIEEAREMVITPQKIQEAKTLILEEKLRIEEEKLQPLEEIIQ